MYYMIQIRECAGNYLETYSLEVSAPIRLEITERRETHCSTAMRHVGKNLRLHLTTQKYLQLYEYMKI